MNTFTYTSGNITPIYLDSLMSIKAEADTDSSLGSVWLFPSLALPLGWQFSISEIPLSKSKEGFIGILTDEEAKEMKERINLFKKSFDEDLARRKKILFGE